MTFRVRGLFAKFWAGASMCVRACEMSVLAYAVFVHARC